MGVNVEPEQDAVPHDTVVAASWQAPAPLQAPVLPHGGLARAAARRLRDADRRRWRSCPRWCRRCTPGTARTTLVLQQTPLMQKLPVRHSLVAAHGWPRRFLLPQRLVFGSQMFGARQSASFRAGAAARGRAVADVGRAGERGRGLTDAQAVAGAAVDLRRLTGWARRRGARRAGAVETAGAVAVAEPVGPAAGRALIRAPRHDVDGSGRDVAAHAGRRGERARLADAGARRLAADALFAEAGEAFVPVGADRAGRLEAAETARADGRRQAVGVRGARRPCRRPVRPFRSDTGSRTSGRA